MSTSLTILLQQKLGYPALNKVDPNTDLIKPGNNETLVGQAAIPAILISMYKYSRSDKGAENILCGDNSTKWLNEFLGKHKEEVVASIATYTSLPETTVKKNMEKVSKSAVSLIRNTNPLTTGDVKNLLGAEKNIALLYLPPAIHMGEYLNDNSIDDNIHKMQGPVSTFMNAIGNIFSESEREGC